MFDQLLASEMEEREQDISKRLCQNAPFFDDLTNTMRIQNAPALISYCILIRPCGGLVNFLIAFQLV